MLLQQHPGLQNAFPFPDCEGKDYSASKHMMAEPAVASRAAAPVAALPIHGTRIDIPHGPGSVHDIPTSSQAQLGVPITSPVNQNGSFEFDRVIKAGYAQRRTQKTKASPYVPLCATGLIIYRISARLNHN